MPAKFKKMYDPDDIALPANYMESHPFAFGVEKIRDEMLAAQPRSEKEMRNHLAEYYAMVTHLDFEIGRLIDHLEKKGLIDDTLIVFTSDNGLAVGSHGLMGKQNHYDHSVRVPLIFAGAGIPKGQRVDNYVYLLDIFPTLCDLCGISIPESVEGKSFAGMFDNPASPSAVTRDSLYFVYNELIRSVKDSRYKLILYRNYAEQMQLFDLIEDPHELCNLASRSEYAEIMARMQSLLHEKRYEWFDTEHRFSRLFWGETE